MGANVIFIRPVEQVGIIYDILRSSKHSNYPVVDTDDKNILFGTIGRNALCVLLQQRAFGHPADASTIGKHTPSIMANYLQIGERRYFPLIQWEILEKSYPKYPNVTDLRITEQDRDQWVDLRPYANTAAVSVQETSSVHVSMMVQLYDAFLILQTLSHLFRLGLLLFAEDIFSLPQSRPTLSPSSEQVQPSRWYHHSKRSHCRRTGSDDARKGKAAFRRSKSRVGSIS